MVHPQQGQRRVARLLPDRGRVLQAGLVVGGNAGTLIAIGGAGLGLFGLYIWQRCD